MGAMNLIFSDDYLVTAKRWIQGHGIGSYRNSLFITNRQNSHYLPHGAA
jgi:hypothetical protein